MIMNDYDYRIELITEAFDKVQKYYSFDVCRKALENIKGRVI